MVFKISGTSAKLTLLGVTLFATAATGQASASELEVAQKTESFSPAPTGRLSTKSDNILIAWMPGKNRNSHLGACTDEEVNEGGCETHTNTTTGASWCTCPKEMGEN